MKPTETWDETIFITGGAGFIGSNLFYYLLPRRPQILFVNLDCLTYAAGAGNVEAMNSYRNYRWENIDLRDRAALGACFDRYRPDGVINLAAETHVDRSIFEPGVFVETNILGTFNLLEEFRRLNCDPKKSRFLQVSTDEVFGSTNGAVLFDENTPYRPNSPYAATKAAADHLVRAYHQTYALNTVITNSGNNFGPYQFLEKLIPLTIYRALLNQSIPLYGDGQNIRDWLYVEDHCRAIEKAYASGRPGATYNISGQNEITNIDLVKQICRIMDVILGGGPREKLISFVTDRPGHDRRYALDSSLAQKELDWRAEFPFDINLRRTVKWYIDHRSWMEKAADSRFQDYYRRQYSGEILPLKEFKP